MKKLKYSFISCLLLVAINTNLQAQCVWTSGGAGDWNTITWTNNSHTSCSGTTPPTDVPSGVTININHDVTLTGTTLTIDSGGLVDIGDVKFTCPAVEVKPGGTIDLDGTHIVLTNGNFKNEGTTLLSNARMDITTGNFQNSGGTVTISNEGCFYLENGNFQNSDGSIATSSGGATGALYLENGNIQNGNGTLDTDQIKWCTVNGDSDLSATTEDCATSETTCENTIPVELAAFSATATLAGVQLNWTTESEIENLGFILERKTADTDWTEIASYTTSDALLGQGSVEYATDYEYIDSFVEVGETYEYRLADVDYHGTATYHAARSITVTRALVAGKVEGFTVLDAYPNPFNPSTTIDYILPQTETDYSTTVEIYDLAGKLVKTLLNEHQSSGWHSVVWNGTNNSETQVPAGVYLSKVSFGSETKTIKVMLLK